MFGIGIQELILIAIVALVVVGPKRLPATLKALGRGIAEFRKVSRQLREEAGFDEVVNEVTKPLREGMAEVHSETQRALDHAGQALGDEYPESGPDDYGALPENAVVYPEAAPVLEQTQAEALEAAGPPKPLLEARPPIEGTVARDVVGSGER